MLDTPTLVKTALHALNGHEGPSREDLCHWYELMHLGRLLDDKAPNYLKQAIGWSYHAPCAGHDGIQLAAGLAFRAGRDFLFPYYRDLVTCLAAGLTPEEMLESSTDGPFGSTGKVNQKVNKAKLQAGRQQRADVG